jgi:hypothetical protein
MRAHVQPPPLPARGGPRSKRPPLLGGFTKVGLVTIALLLLALIWDDLRTVEGRALLWDRTRGLLSSIDSYAFVAVLLVNSLVYSLIIKHVYRDGKATLRGLARAIMLLKSDEHDMNSDGSEIGHFFLIFVLPAMVFGAGVVEYRLLTTWLHK